MAAVAFLVYTRAVFGSWSPVAGYEAVGGFYGLSGLGEHASNVLSAFLDPHHGVLIWSSWIVVCIAFAFRRRRQRPPAWLAATPLIAAAYVITHSLMEVASGALPYNYRYPLEAVTLAAPFLLAAIPSLTETRIRLVSLIAAGTLAVFLQASFLYLSTCDQGVCSMFG
jgi:hypothetical protein